MMIPSLETLFPFRVDRELFIPTWKKTVVLKLLKNDIFSNSFKTAYGIDGIITYPIFLKIKGKKVIYKKSQAQILVEIEFIQDGSESVFLNAYMNLNYDECVIYYQNDWDLYHHLVR